MARFAVWGFGPSSSELVCGGEATGLAYDVAMRWCDPAQFAPRGELRDEWVVEVEADEEDLDEQTRHDRATIGYCSIDGTIEDLGARVLDAAAKAIDASARDLAEHFCRLRPLDAGRAWDSRHDELCRVLAAHAGVDPDAVGAPTLVAEFFPPIEYDHSLRPAVVEYLTP